MAPDLPSQHELAQKTDAFLALPPRGRMHLLHVWGHAYEFPSDDNWAVIEQFCDRVAQEHHSIWFATNIEIVDYLNAVKSLRTTANGDIVENHSSVAVWISTDEKSYVIQPGERLRLGVLSAR